MSALTAVSKNSTNNLRPPAPTGTASPASQNHAQKPNQSSLNFNSGDSTNGDEANCHSAVRSAKNNPGVPTRSNNPKTTTQQTKAQPVNQPTYYPHLQSPGQSNTNDNTKKIRCNCTKSKCLRLYCDCLRNNLMCKPNCICFDCHNTPAYEGPGGERTLAWEAIFGMRSLEEGHPHPAKQEMHKKREEDVKNLVIVNSLKEAPATVPFGMGRKRRLDGVTAKKLIGDNKKTRPYGGKLSSKKEEKKQKVKLQSGGGSIDATNKDVDNTNSDDQSQLLSTKHDKTTKSDMPEQTETDPKKTQPINNSAQNTQPLSRTETQPLNPPVVQNPPPSSKSIVSIPRQIKNLLASATTTPNNAANENQPISNHHNQFQIKQKIQSLCLTGLTTIQELRIQEDEAQYKQTMMELQRQIKVKRKRIARLLGLEMDYDDGEDLISGSHVENKIIDHRDETMADQHQLTQQQQQHEHQQQGSGAKIKSTSPPPPSQQNPWKEAILLLRENTPHLEQNVSHLLQMQRGDVPSYDDEDVDIGTTSIRSDVDNVLSKSFSEQDRSSNVLSQRETTTIISGSTSSVLAKKKDNNANNYCYLLASRIIQDECEEIEIYERCDNIKITGIDERLGGRGEDINMGDEDEDVDCF